jgi:hypothetical protein
MKMTPEETLLIERECERLVVEAVYRADRQDYAGLAALFTAVHRQLGEAGVRPFRPRGGREAARGGV